MNRDHFKVPPDSYKMIKTSDRKGIFKKGVELDVGLYYTPTVGKPIWGTDSRGEFKTTNVESMEVQGPTLIVHTKNSTYRFVPNTGG
jgi:hypothetical protein